MATSRVLFAILAAAAGLEAAAVPSGATLVEAESFRDPGGWVADQQFQDQMGSPFLLAHGLGVPVADAKTEVQVGAPGAYRVWVRTRDWVARWNAPGAPGRFQLLVNGALLPATFGTSGADWHWQDGGIVRLRSRSVQLALHDLTGFDGRCDAILLVAADSKWTPPDGAELASLRKKLLGLPASPVDAGTFDLVVVGGGMAGTAAAVAGARLGLQVALVHDRPVLGGNASSEVRVFPGGRTMLGPYPGLGAIEHELDPGSVPGVDKSDGSRNAGDARLYADEKKLYVVESEKNLKLLLNLHVTGVEKSGQRIVAVFARETHTGKELRVRSKLFADCTGDATVGFLAAADYRVGREGRDETGEDLAPEKADNQVMGASYMWYADETQNPAAFPETPWALEFNERTAQRGSRGDWDWETGMRQDQVGEAEAIRDHAYRAIYGNWSFLKNHAENRQIYAKQKLSWVAWVAGKRESRRLLGDVILKQQDLQQRVEFPDASVSTTWGIDLHYPAPENSKAFPGGEFRSIYKSAKHEPYAIPYRCFYSRNIGNLFMAGRDISVTHVMLGTVRVQRTTAMMGEVVGMAASIAAKHGVTPRGVYEQYLDELKVLMRTGVGKEDAVTAAARVPLGFSAAGDANWNWKPAIASRVPVRIWLEVIPDPKGDHAATAEVFHNGFHAVRHVNLSEGSRRWLDLGVFQFSGNPIDFVRLVRHDPAAVVHPGTVKFEVLRGDAATVRNTLLVEAK
jgi:hypothetical protein